MGLIFAGYYYIHIFFLFTQLIANGEAVRFSVCCPAGLRRVLTGPVLSLFEVSFLLPVVACRARNHSRRTPSRLTSACLSAQETHESIGCFRAVFMDDVCVSLVASSSPCPGALSLYSACRPRGRHDIHHASSRLRARSVACACAPLVHGACEHSICLPDSVFTCADASRASRTCRCVWSVVGASVLLHRALCHAAQCCMTVHSQTDSD